MKAVFGVVSLIVVLAIVMFVARKQVQPGAVAGIVAADPKVTIASQARAVKDKARADVSRALQEGAQRTDSADR